MNSSTYTLLFLLILIVVFKRERRNKTIIQHVLKKKKGDMAMKELAQKFIGKECLIYTVAGTQIEGTVNEIEGNAALIEKNGAVEAVNLDFVVRIREYPRNKNGKKKSVVLD